MLVEIAVQNLGVIAHTEIIFDRGMTVFSGETGAGKTLLVDAISLLVGAKADPTFVRHGTDQARVDGRFAVTKTQFLEVASALGDADLLGRKWDDDSSDETLVEEIVLSRVIPAQGRSRGYINGRPATLGELAAWGGVLVDLHGQHAHQSLLRPAIQRNILDRFAHIDLSNLQGALSKLREIENRQASLGGDERERAREIDLYRFQVDEITAAQITDALEDDRLADEQDVLGDAESHQIDARVATESLTGEGGAIERLGAVIQALGGKKLFEASEQRLRSTSAELVDVAAELRDLAETIEPNPQRADEIRQRRQLLSDLRRKYGETLTEVISYGEEAAQRLAKLVDHDRQAAELDEALKEANEQYLAAAKQVQAERSAAAPKLAQAIESHLAELAMPNARVQVTVGEEAPGDEVKILIAANKGSDFHPLEKVASGGELARIMLSIRLVLTAGPPVLIFDEVDAGIGGEAAIAVGRSLAKLSPDHQVLVVTHLAQVAAFADNAVQVTKVDRDDQTVSIATRLDPTQRVGELARMLSGNEISVTAREHAAELLALAAEQR